MLHDPRNSTAASRSDQIAAGGLQDYAAVRRAIEYLAEAWQTQPGLDELAAYMGLSPSHCQRLFKRWCGLSPKELVQALTIEHARKLLEDRASVLATAYEVGLSGASRLHDLFVDYEAMTPGEFKARGAGLVIRYGFHPSPFGLALLMATERGVAGLAFCDEAAAKDAALADMTRRWPEARYVEDAAATGIFARQVFDPSSWRADRPVRLVLMGSDFELKVWETLLKIPMGRAVSYGDIASHLGRPGAARAVGSAVGRNPISFVVPCHRVLRTDGNLGGYHWGITRKRAMIGWEAGRMAAA